MHRAGSTAPRALRVLGFVRRWNRHVPGVILFAPCTGLYRRIVRNELIARRDKLFVLINSLLPYALEPDPV